MPPGAAGPASGGSTATGSSAFSSPAAGSNPPRMKYATSATTTGSTMIPALAAPDSRKYKLCERSSSMALYIASTE